VSLAGWDPPVGLGLDSARARASCWRDLSHCLVGPGVGCVLNPSDSERNCAPAASPRFRFPRARWPLLGYKSDLWRRYPSPYLRDHLAILTGTWGDQHFSSSVHGQICRLGLLSTVRHHSTSGGCPGSVAGGWRCRPWARRKGSTDRSMEFHIGVHHHHGICCAPWPPNHSP
jgi:hypothetical protein